MQVNLEGAIDHPPRLSRQFTVAAVLLSLLVAISVPLGYGFILYRYHKAAIAGEAELAARDVSARIALNPEMWQYETYRLQHLADGTKAAWEKEPHTQRRQILGKYRELIVESIRHGEFYPFHIMAEQPLVDAGRTVGYFTIEASMRDVVEETTKVALISTLVGFLMFAGLHQLPLRALRKAERDLSYLAHHDPLTRLPNRVLFGDRLAQALQRARRGRNKVGLFFMDLDHFKTINDSLGHVAGDTILTQVVERLSARIRKSDTMARISGDEFMVIAEGGHRASDFLELARQLRTGLEDPFFIGGQEIYVTLSGGIAIFPDDAPDASLLIRNADLAMYDAKQSGRDNFKFFTLTLTDEMRHRSALHLRLRHAMEHGEFRLHYQPIHHAVDDARCGVEALLRWEREPGVFAEPDEFISTLEETGLIVPVGEWVIEEACRQLAKWQAEGIGELTVSVNISTRQFHDGTLVAHVRQALGKYGVPPERLVIEITESLLLDDEATAEAQLEDLSELGVGIALDDFGTGYSSLNYLQRLPLDLIKIDRSFVAPLSHGSSRSDVQIVNAIIDLAHGLGLMVTAEGIETAEQLAILKELKCDRLQGYYFGRPAPMPHSPEPSQLELLPVEPLPAPA